MLKSVRPEESVEVTAFAAKSQHASSAQGASQRKQCVAFVPLRDNEEFRPLEGMTCGKSFAYSHLVTIDFALDYSLLVAWFTSHRVTVTGRNLKVLLDGLESSRCELIEQKAVDPVLEAKTAETVNLAANAPFVAGLRLEAIE